MVQPGDKVRKKANPGRTGLLGQKTTGPPAHPRGLVTWLDNNQEEFVLLSTLEQAGNSREDPYDLITTGRYGRVKDLRGAITSHRLGGRLSNVIYSLETTNTEFLPYQFKPVLQFLESPTNSLLIADEVGLGKTIEAGLIWTELRARLDAKRLLIVCPAMLRSKWKRELDLRFGVKADIVDAAELLERLTSAKNQPYESFALIASYQGIRPPSEAARRETRLSNAARLANFLDESVFEESLIDLVVFDEAHYLRNSETKTHALADLLRPVAGSVVMLSATPIQLRSTDLFNLLNILDAEAFPYESSFDDQIRMNEPLLRLRDQLLRTVIEPDEFVDTLQQLANGELRDSEQVDYLLHNPPSREQLSSASDRSALADQLDRINPLTKMISRTRKRDVNVGLVLREASLLRAKMNDAEKNFYYSVTEAIREFCSKLEVAEGFLLTIPQRQMASCMPAACRRWRDRLESKQALADQEELYELSDNQDSSSSKEDNNGVLLTELLRIAESVGDYDDLRTSDSKYQEFLRAVQEYWAAGDRRKIVLFSFFKDTLKYLKERLEEDGIKSIILHGDIDKDEALTAFKDPEGPSILLSSEVASEGVDLQFSSVLINYDLPWNPAKIEQRIGRIDRIGQQENRILIWNLVYGDTVDDRVCSRLLDRVDIFESTLGAAEIVLGREVQKLTQDLLTHSLTPEQELERIEQTKVALATNALQQTQLEREAGNLIAHGDFIQGKVQTAKDLGRFVSGDDLFAFVSDYLLTVFQGTRLVETPRRENHYKLELSVDARLQFDEYLTRSYTQNKTQLLRTNAPLLLFENRVGGTTPGVEKVTQDHPLVRFISEHQSQTNRTDLYADVVAVQVNSPDQEHISAGIYVFAVERWDVAGARETERLEYRVKRLDNGEPLTPELAELLVNRAAIDGEDFVAASSVIDGPIAAELHNRCRNELEEAFYAFRDAFEREDHDRIRMMTKTLKDHYTRKTARLKDRIRAAEESGDEGRIRNIASLKGQITKEDKSIAQKIEEMNARSTQLMARNALVTSGVIRVK